MVSCKVIIFTFATLLPILHATPQFQNHHSQHPDNYGKPCTRSSPPDGNLVHCNLDLNMYCSEKGVCECLVGEKGRVFAHYQRRCIEVASTENEFACREDQECKLSEYGKYSRCNRDYDRCECHDENEKAVLVGKVCFIQKLASRSSPFRFQGCSSDGDCQGSVLGNLTRCNKATNACKCYDRSNGNRNVGLYRGICLYQKSLTEFCEDDGECRIGYHKNAICAGHATYLRGEKICQCPEGQNCDDDGSGAYSPYQVQSQSMIMIGITTAVMGVLATKVLS